MQASIKGVTILPETFENIRLAPDGIWYAEGGEDVSYPEDGHADCLGVEEQSFWFAHRNAVITALIDRFPPPGGGSILDIGGGNGFVTKAIIESGHDAILMEPGIIGALNAKQRDLPHIICATLEAAGTKAESLAAVGLFDVVEHIERDIEFLGSVSDRLVSGGRVYLTVPAYRFLWSNEDINAGHFRRYSLGKIKRRLRAVGFEVDFATYIFRFLPLPIFLLRSVPYRLGLSSSRPKLDRAQDHHLSSKSALRRIADRLLSVEVRKILSGQQMIFGGTCLVAAHKSQKRADEGTV